MRTTEDMKPHPISPDSLPALHRLNQDHALELSSLTLDEFAHVVARTTYARAIGDEGMLLVFDQNADYNSMNFLWFRERYEAFAYVDRIVISPARQGEGLARQFYEDLFDWAREAGLERVVAEYNSEPLNAASEAFHAKLGFEPLSDMVMEGRGKSVRYVVRELAP